MKNLRSIVFFGTHELAVPALDTLARLDLVPRLVVTRPRAGLPGEDSVRHPVRPWARERGIELVRSRRAAETRLHERITALEPDLLVVADYGRPLPAELLGAAPRGAIEVHPSLLPKLRGEHALRAALAAGAKETGVSVIQVDEEPWGGPILLQEKLAIGERDTFGELVVPAQELAGRLLAEALRRLDRGNGGPRGRSQKADNATPTPRFGGRHRKVPWQLEAKQIYDRLRAYSPTGLLTSFRYRSVEILSGLPMGWVGAPSGDTGTYIGMRGGKLAVLCGGSTIFGIERLRRPGEEAQGASAFAREEEIAVGAGFV